MTTRALLIGPVMEGGEGTYLHLLQSHPPEGIDYRAVGGFHEGAPGVRCQLAWEVALNRLVRPRAIPDVGFRALRLRDSFDLVHVHAHPVRLTGLGGTPLVMSEGSSSAVYLGDYLGWDSDRLARGFRRARRMYRALGLHDRLLAMEQAARVYVFSEWARDVNVRWGADPGKVEVVPPGFPVPELVGRREEDTFSFLFVGTDFERKGGFDVLEAFERVSERHPNARLILAGSDPWRRNPDRLIHAWVSDARRARLLATLENLQRRGVIRLTGPMPSNLVRTTLYPAAAAFVMPTLAEGFGFTNVEAMSFGLPVISSRVGPIPEVVSHGKTGLLVEPGDPDELVDAMERLVSAPELTRSMGAAARCDFLDRYTLDHFRSRLTAVYGQALRAT
jgi:glycosyltransferase involved in cell wall biosynthesis